MFFRFHILFLFFVSGMFCISVTSLFGYHLYLVTRNQTTLESFRAPIFRPNLVPDKRGFHLGTMNNVQEVFGDTRFLWFFPVDSGLGDGICFPQRSTFSQHDEEMGYLEASTVPTVRNHLECVKKINYPIIFKAVVLHFNTYNHLYFSAEEHPAITKRSYVKKTFWYK